MKINNELTQDLFHLKEVGDKLLEKYEDIILDILREEHTDPEELLHQDIMFDVLDHLKAISEMVGYMERDIIKEGTLSRNADGKILLNGELLPLMTKVEVLVKDAELNCHSWLRTFVAGRNGNRLVGIDRDVDISGLKARIRA